MKLILALSLVPSIALAHPGHHEHDGGNSAFNANWVVVLALCIALAYAVNLVIKKWVR